MAATTAISSQSANSSSGTKKPKVPANPVFSAIRRISNALAGVPAAKRKAVIDLVMAEYAGN